MDELIAELKRNTRVQRRLARAIEGLAGATAALVEQFAGADDGQPDDSKPDETLDGDSLN